MRSALALVAVLLGVVALSSSARGAESAPAAGPRVTMFGDSIADSLDYVPEARELLGEGVDLRLELTPCRKLVPVGCAYMGARPPSVLDIVTSSTLAQLGNIVIVAVGYNDPANNYETDMAQVANALVERGVGHVIWVTLRDQTDDYRQINETIKAQAPRWPELRVADWEVESRQGLVQPGRAAPERRRCGRPGDAAPPVRAHGLRIGVRGPRHEGAAQRPAPDAPGHARGRPRTHVPAWRLERTRADRLLLPLAPRHEGAPHAVGGTHVARARRPRPRRSRAGSGRGTPAARPPRPRSPFASARRRDPQSTAWAAQDSNLRPPACRAGASRPNVLQPGG